MFLERTERSACLDRTGWVIRSVLQEGMEANLFGLEMGGYLMVASEKGYLLQALATEEPSLITADYHVSAEYQVRYLRANGCLTSWRSPSRTVGGAVAVRGSRSIIAYASGSNDRGWNRAIAIATAIRMHELSIDDVRQKVKDMRHIDALLAVAHWTE